MRPKAEYANAPNSRNTKILSQIVSSLLGLYTKVNARIGPPVVFNVVSDGR